MDVRSTWEMLWRFHRNESGNVAMMFGLALIPLLGLAGVAIDYSNATRTQVDMQSALDGAALAGVSHLKKPDAELKEVVGKYLNANLPSSLRGKPFEIEVRDNRSVLLVRMTAEVKSNFTQVIGSPSMTLRSARFVLIARSIATGSTPGCDQKRWSSAATVAATRIGGSVSAVNLTLRVPSPDSASYSGSPLRSTMSVDVPVSSRRPAGRGPRRSQRGMATTTVRPAKAGLHRRFARPAEAGLHRVIV